MPLPPLGLASLGYHPPIPFSPTLDPFSPCLSPSRSTLTQPHIHTHKSNVGWHKYLFLCSLSLLFPPLHPSLTLTFSHSQLVFHTIPLEFLSVLLIRIITELSSCHHTSSHLILSFSSHHRLCLSSYTCTHLRQTTTPVDPISH